LRKQKTNLFFFILNDSTSDLLLCNNEDEIPEVMVLQHYQNADSYNTTEKEDESGEEQYQVEKILRVAKVDKFLNALVLWKDYLEPTWEPFCFVSSTDAYKEFFKNGV